MTEHNLHDFRGFRGEDSEAVVPEAACNQEATVDCRDEAIGANFNLLTEIVAQMSLHCWIIVGGCLRQHGIHGEWQILRLIVTVICVAWTLNVRRVVAVPTINRKLMTSCYSHNRRQRQLRVSVRRNVNDWRVKMELQ